MKANRGIYVTTEEPVPRLASRLEKTQVEMWSLVHRWPDPQSVVIYFAYCCQIYAKEAM